MLKISRRQLTLGAAFAALVSVAPRAFAADTADTIYSGGPILTMDDAAPRAEAVAVKGGRILAVGAAADVMKLKGDSTKLVDLGGRTMLPGFIDPHGHTSLGGLQALSANLLPPPDGVVDSIPALLKVMTDYSTEHADRIKEAKILIGFGYDNAQLKELRHPTKEDLDKVSTDYPVLAIHQSGHIAALNSKGLEVVGYTAATPNPVGGVIDRMPGSQEPNGVLEETAWFDKVTTLLGGIGPTGMVALVKAGQDLWASYGYTTAQEGRATPGLADVIKSLGEKGELKVDIPVYMEALSSKDYIKANVSPSYVNHTRIAGGKLVIDGTPQGFTALRDQPYYKPVGNYPPDYKGVQDATNDQVIDMFDWAYANGVQMLTHSNGEAATDLLISAIRNAQQKHGKLPVKPVLVHGQFQREDQVDSVVELGIFPSLFPMHTFYWGDWYRETVIGAADADNISPTGWYRTRGSMFSTHSDAPVTYPNTIRVLAATVTRRSRSGDILGPTQRVSAEEGLKAMTLWPAFQYGEEKYKGSIEVGKLADFVILTEDPTAIDPETIIDVKVAETIKEGVSIYAATPEQLKKASLDKGLGHPFSDFLAALATQRELKSMPEGRQTPLMKKLVASAPHNGGCVCGLLFDLQRVILGEETSLGLV